MPSNILYHTPSSGNRDRYSNNSPPHNFDQSICEFNDSVEQIFDTTKTKYVRPHHPFAVEML